ncbi:Putative membrane spanning protein [Shigella dysenteriae 1617]|uniref:Putative membrane spanning protein n=1 Tax=Shigella dysenteriae 1617 TaxID=754093 RepID=A0A0A6ZVK7_SHIDY|nr:Putative membrane spanning protein [Shigella dysenteriae 1617]
MMLIGAALMRSGWLKGQFRLRHYRRTGFVLVAIGVTINLPAIALQWQLDWAIPCVPSYFKCRGN